VLADDVGTMTVELLYSVMIGEGFDTSFIGVIEAGAAAGIVLAATGQIVV
jgi:hypothetical protein